MLAVTTAKIILEKSIHKKFVVTHNLTTQLFLILMFQQITKAGVLSYHITTSKVPLM